MPPKKRKGKKGKKGKKKGAKKKTEVDPPPLHDLTQLYNLLQEKVRHLNEMRVLSRKKRLEAWFMTREISNNKSDNAIYRDYLDDTINDLYDIIAKIRDQIAKERASIQKEIDRLMAELNKRHEQILKQTAELEEQLEKAKLDLLEFEPLMQRLAKMLGKLEELAKQIAAAELDADIKTRHLKNQFLFERARLHNHLEKQLFDLIQNCRSYIMPIMWHHMRKIQFSNACARWKLTREDAKNIRLGELRDDLQLRRKLLTIEKSYMGVDWAFFKLAEAQNERKQRILSARKASKPAAEEPPTELAIAFNVYLKKRLTAYHEAKKRAAKLKLIQSLRSPTIVVEGPSPPDDGEYDGEGAVYDDEWEDVDQVETEAVKPKRRKHRRRRPKYYLDGEEEDGEEEFEDNEEEDEDDDEGDLSGSSSEEDEEEEEEEDTLESDGQPVAVSSSNPQTMVAVTKKSVTNSRISIKSKT